MAKEMIHLDIMTTPLDIPIIYIREGDSGGYTLAVTISENSRVLNLQNTSANTNKIYLEARSPQTGKYIKDNSGVAWTNSGLTMGSFDYTFRKDFVERGRIINAYFSVEGTDGSRRATNSFRIIVLDSAS